MRERAPERPDRRIGFTPPRSDWAYRIYRFVAGSIARLLFDIRITGSEHLVAPEGPTILAAVPHRNWSEPLLLSAVVPASPPSLPERRVPAPPRNDVRPPERSVVTPERPPAAPERSTAAPERRASTPQGSASAPERDDADGGAAIDWLLKRPGDPNR